MSGIKMATTTSHGSPQWVSPDLGLLFSRCRTEETYVGLHSLGEGIGFGSRFCQHICPFPGLILPPSLPLSSCPVLPPPHLHHPPTQRSRSTGQWRNLLPAVPVMCLLGAETQWWFTALLWHLVLAVQAYFWCCGLQDWALRFLSVTTWTENQEYIGESEISVDFRICGLQIHGGDLPGLFEGDQIWGLIASAGLSEDCRDFVGLRNVCYEQRKMWLPVLRENRMWCFCALIRHPEA